MLHRSIRLSCIVFFTDAPEENAWPVADEEKDAAKSGARAPDAQPDPPSQEVTQPDQPLLVNPAYQSRFAPRTLRHRWRGPAMAE